MAVASSADDPLSWVVSLRESMEQRIADQRAILELAVAELNKASAASHEDIRHYFERLISDLQASAIAIRAADQSQLDRRIAALRDERREDRENRAIEAGHTADVTAFQLASRKEWQSGHLELHGKEREALDALARVLAAQRVEDAHTVEIALATVREASIEHADAHRMEHLAHDNVHQIEKEAMDRTSASLDKRLEGMSEFREQLNQQAVSFVGRDLFESRAAGLQRERDETMGKINDQATRITQLEVATATKSHSGEMTSRTALAITGFLITLFVTAVVIVTNVLIAKP